MPQRVEAELLALELGRALRGDEVRLELVGALLELVPIVARLGVVRAAVCVRHVGSLLEEMTLLICSNTDPAGGWRVEGNERDSKEG